MLTIDTLKAFGANTDEGIGRCMNNEAFYLRLVKMIPQDKNFSRLYECIDSNDLEGAFEAAHALKGALGNLSLTPLYGKAWEITELLRNRTQMDYSPIVAEIKALQDKLIGLCSD
ncbi:MAG: Hpt domain-containing protein [Spirochaetales bacterium]|nr:Hpt domain-containing protein [Spirochaetales bacterium]